MWIKANAANTRIMTPVHRKMTFGIYAAIKHNRKSNDTIEFNVTKKTVSNCQKFKDIECEC
jgi:hypothetical protein